MGTDKKATSKTYNQESMIKVEGYDYITRLLLFREVAQIQIGRKAVLKKNESNFDEYFKRITLEVG